MKTTITKQTLAQMTDPHVEKVLDSIHGRDMAQVWGALEKFANHILDLNGPQINEKEFAEEIRNLIEYRSECVTERDSEDRGNDYPADSEHA